MREVKRPTRDNPRERGRGHTTMERRKFLIGAGALASGSAAAVGTGAFSSVSADREVSVRVAGDSSAYLTLRNSSNRNSAYADGSGAQMTVDLDGSDNNPGGDGVNQDALTTIYDIFSIRNRGSQEVLVYADRQTLRNQNAYDQSTDGIYFDPQLSGMPNGRNDEVLGTLADGTLYTSLTANGGSGDTFAEDILESNSEAPAGPAVYLLRPGEEFDFGAYVKTNDSATGTVNYNVDIVASASLAQEARNQGKMTVSQNL